MKISRIAGLLGLVLVGGTVAGASPAVRIRLRLMGLKLVGRLPDVPVRDFLPLMKPHSGFDMEALLESRSGASTLLLPDELAGDTLVGSRLFEQRCARCHGPQGEGNVGPSLVAGTPRHGASDWSMYLVIRNGVPATAMQPTGLSFGEAWQVIALLRARQRGLAKAVPAVPARARPVEEADLAAGDVREEEWLSWSGGWSGRRHRVAPELTAEALARLRLAWAYQLPPDPEVSQSAPIAVGRLLIVTSAEDVIALDAATGGVVWRRHHPVRGSPQLCCARSNRGVAVYGTRVFVGTLDGRLLALDLDTGRQVWETEVGDPREGVSLTGAPLVADGRVIVGMGGGEFGVRGYLDAYDPGSGKRLWRFYTVPRQGEPGSETWPAGGMSHGGGGTWTTGAYDPDRHLLYWGTGNPAPVFAPELRPGDNLYTCSVIALDIRTGTLRWSYQFTPNDSHDWDSAQTPILVDGAWKGRSRPLMLWANRNGFVYVLDRETGEFLYATPFVRQTWNEGFDSAGRPRVAAATAPTPGGTLVYPSANGAANWRPASYSPELGLLFIAGIEKGGLYIRTRNDAGARGTYLGGSAVPLKAARSFVAFDLASGTFRWRVAGPPDSSSAIGGLLSVGDRLVLGGAGTQVFAMDARTGHRVWSVRLGANVVTAPVLFRVEGQPRVAVTAGSVLFVFGLNGPAAHPATGRMEAAAAR